MSDCANTTATAAKTPFAFDAHERPGTVANFLIVPRAAQKIIPTQLQPSGPTVAARIGPGMLQPVAGHRAIDGAGASVGITNHAGHVGTVLGKYYFGIAEAIARCPPLAFDCGQRRARRFVGSFRGGGGLGFGSRLRRRRRLFGAGFCGGVRLCGV